MSFDQDVDRALLSAEIEDEQWWEAFLLAEDAYEADILTQAGGWEGVENDLAG